jgi:hypothetical protein
MPGGDENAAKDVTRLIENLARIGDGRQALIVVHHSGKDLAQGMRGAAELGVAGARACPCPSSAPSAWALSSSTSSGTSRKGQTPPRRRRTKSTAFVPERTDKTAPRIAQHCHDQVHLTSSRRRSKPASRRSRSAAAGRAASRTAPSPALLPRRARPARQEGDVDLAARSPGFFRGPLVVSTRVLPGARKRCGSAARRIRLQPWIFLGMQC